MTMLSHNMTNDKGVHMTDKEKGQMDQKSFMQKHKNMTCYKCGKKGHYANKCPSGDNNDNEVSTRSNLLSNHSNHSLIKKNNKKETNLKSHKPITSIIRLCCTRVREQV